MKVHAEELLESETDDRGRIYLGTEYANRRVTVAIVEVGSVDPDEEELAAAYRDAAENSEALDGEWTGGVGEAWEGSDE